MACAAAAAVVVALLPARPDIQIIQTAAGETRQLALTDGSRIEIAGGSRLQIDRAHPRQISMDRGEALFHVRHDAADPFIVRSGALEVQDVGTVFNVVRAGSQLRVAVAEGSVLFQPGREEVALRKGQALAMRDGEDQIELSHVAAEGVGGWAGNHLDFRQVALSTVAEDVSRSTGVHLAVAPAMAATSFTGTLRLDRSSEEVMRSLAALAGAELRQDGPNWMIRPKSGGAR